MIYGAILTIVDDAGIDLSNGTVFYGMDCAVVPLLIAERLPSQAFSHLKFGAQLRGDRPLACGQLAPDLKNWIHLAHLLAHSFAH